MLKRLPGITFQLSNSHKIMSFFANWNMLFSFCKNFFFSDPKQKANNKRRWAKRNPLQIATVFEIVQLHSAFGVSHTHNLSLRDTRDKSMCVSVIFISPSVSCFVCCESPVFRRHTHISFTQRMYRNANIWITNMLLSLPFRGDFLVIQKTKKRNEWKREKHTHNELNDLAERKFE